MSPWILISDAAAIVWGVGGVVIPFSLWRIARAQEQIAGATDLAAMIACSEVAGHAPPVGPIPAEIGRERMRQEEADDLAAEHDDTQDAGQLARAAAAYAWAAAPRDKEDAGRIGRMRPWPIPNEDPRRLLILAGALIVAEVERLDRKEEKTK